MTVPLAPAATGWSSAIVTVPDPDTHDPVYGAAIVHPTKLALDGRVSVSVTPRAAPGVAVASEVFAKLMV